MIINNHPPHSLTFLDGGFARGQRPSSIDLVQDEMDTYNLRSYKDRMTKIHDRFSNGYDLSDAKSNFVATITNKDRNPASGNLVVLPESRLERGKEVGLIDYGVGALIKIDHKWVDHQLKKEVGSDDDLAGFLKEKGVTFAPVITKQMLSDFEESGKIVIGGKTVSTRTDDRSGRIMTWELDGTDATIRGSAERALMHSSTVFISPEQLSTEEIWHGTLSSSKDEIEHNKEALSLSRRGVGLYGTMSKVEAATIYANPFHHMVREKRLTYGSETGKTDDYGHLVKLGSTAKTTPFIANWGEGSHFKSALNTPSPFLIEAICNQFRNESPEAVSGRIRRVEEVAISSIFEAQSNYEIYMAIDTLSSDLLGVHNDASLKLGAPISKVFQSLGYDTLEITPPTPEQLNKITDTKLAVINDIDHVQDVAKDNSVSIKSLTDSIDDLSERIRTTTPKNLDQGHVIFFAENTAPEFGETLSLPTHNSLLGIEEQNPRQPFEPYYDSFFDPENDNLERFNSWAIGLIDSSRSKSITEKGIDNIPPAPIPRATLKL